MRNRSPMARPITNWSRWATSVLGDRIETRRLHVGDASAAGRDDTPRCLRQGHHPKKLLSESPLLIAIGLTSFGFKRRPSAFLHLVVD